MSTALLSRQKIVTPARCAMAISPAFVVFQDGSVRVTPDNTWSQGLGALLDRVAPAAGEMVLLLAGAAARQLDLPTEPNGRNRRGIERATAAGWKLTSERDGWLTFAHADRVVIVAIAPLLDYARFPLMDPPNSLVGVPSLALWHELAGRAWRGTPGVVGMTLLRDHAPVYRTEGRQSFVTWKPHNVGPARAKETTWTTWNSTAAEATNAGRYIHRYDARRAYLNAFGTCESLAPWTLRNTGRAEFDPSRAGWWEVELAPWQWEHLPHPAGPTRESVRWLTTPTLILLQQLTEEGRYGGFTVLDSWTGTGKRMFRSFAEHVEGVYQRATQMSRETEPTGMPTSRAMDAGRVREAAKALYRETYGLLNLHTNSAYRPDWHFAIMAQARCSIWRTIDRAAREDGRFPVSWVNTDTVLYRSDEPDPWKAVPPSIKLGDKLGHFHSKLVTV